MKKKAKKKVAKKTTSKTVPKKPTLESRMTYVQTMLVAMYRLLQEMSLWRTDEAPRLHIDIADSSKDYYEKIERRFDGMVDLLFDVKHDVRSDMRAYGQSKEPDLMRKVDLMLLRMSDIDASLRALRGQKDVDFDSAPQSDTRPDELMGRA